MTPRLFLLYTLPFTDGEIKQQLFPQSTHLTLMKNLSDDLFFLKKRYLDYGVSLMWIILLCLKQHLCFVLMVISNIVKNYF